jgi:hypothetical protein
VLGVFGFCCRVTGFPRPRVMWLVNGNTVVNVNLEKIFGFVKFVS